MINLTRTAAAQKLGISDDSLDKLIARGELPHIRIGRRVLIPDELLDEWMRARAEANMRAPKPETAAPVRRRRRVVQPVAAAVPGDKPRCGPMRPVEISELEQ